MSKYIMTLLMLCLCLPTFSAQTSVKAVAPSTSKMSLIQQETDLASKRLKSLSEKVKEKIVSPEKLGSMLAEAVMKNNPERVKELLNSGADVNFVYKNKTILSYALENCSKKGQTQVLELLLKSPALKYAGESAMCCASGLIQKGEEALFQQMMLKLNLNPNRACKKMDLPLFLAIRYLRFDTVEFLLNHGASLNVVDKKGIFPLYAFVLNVGYYGYQKNGEQEERILNLLLQKDPLSVLRQLPESGTTPLMIAVYYGQISLVDTLWTFVKTNHLDENIFLNAQNKNGETALFYAVLRNNLQTALELVRVGANPDIPDAKGITPIMYAKRKGFYELAAKMELNRR